MNERPPFAGAILTGGRSQRMGRDKAMVAVDGAPMVSRVADAFRTAGAAAVFAVGGDHDSLATLGIRVFDDSAPRHSGPLAGIITALGATTHEVVVVTACDMPWIEAAHVRSLVDALVDAPAGTDVAVGAADGQDQPLHAAWHRRSLPKLRDAFAAGERSPTRVIATLNPVVVELGLGRWGTDVDTPDDLPEPN